MSRQRHPTGNKRGRPSREEDPTYKAKAKMIAAMSLQGMTNQQIGTIVGQDSRTVQRYRTFAKDQGFMEEVRKDLGQRLLPKSTDVYEHILDTPVEKLQENPKGYKLKLDAAKDVAQGLGAFRKESSSTSKSLKGTVDLDEYLKIRALKNDLDGTKKLKPADVIDIVPTETDDEHMRGQLPRAVGDPVEVEGNRQGELFSDLRVPTREGVDGQVGRGSDPSGAGGDRGTERQAGAGAGTLMDDRGTLPAIEGGEEVTPTEAR